MRFVDENVCINVGRINPISTEVLWQTTSWLDYLRFNWSNSQSLWTLFDGFQCIAEENENIHMHYKVILTKFTSTIHQNSVGQFSKKILNSPLSRNGNTNVQIVVTIFQEATIFFIFSTFFRICHGEIVIFADKPVAKATVLNNTVEGARHALALLVCNIEFLVGDQELRTGRLTRTNLSVGIVTFASESEAILQEMNYDEINICKYSKKCHNRELDPPDKQIARRLQAMTDN